MKLLDLLCQDRVVIHDAVDDFVRPEVLLPDLHDIDALPGSGADGDILAADVAACSQEFVAFQRRDDEDLSALPTHSERDQLQRERLARAAGTKQNHVGVLVRSAVEDIHDHQTVVVLVDAQKDPVLVRHLIARVGVAAGSRRGQRRRVLRTI